MASAPWPQPGIPTPAHTDEGGPWWEIPEIAHWWIRPREWIDPDLDGFEARHKHGYLTDVTAPSMYLLAVFTFHAQMLYVRQQREQREASAT